MIRFLQRLWRGAPAVDGLPTVEDHLDGLCDPYTCPHCIAGGEGRR